MHYSPQQLLLNWKKRYYQLEKAYEDLESLYTRTKQFQERDFLKHTHILYTALQIIQDLQKENERLQQERSNDQPFLDDKHPCYSPKLAAALKAWQEVQEDEHIQKGLKSPKQVLEKWLKAQAGEYGLIKKDGRINNEGIEQIAKVVNWKPEGGANKTAC